MWRVIIKSQILNKNTLRKLRPMSGRWKNFVEVFLWNSYCLVPSLWLNRVAAAAVEYWITKILLTRKIGLIYRKSDNGNIISGALRPPAKFYQNQTKIYESYPCSKSYTMLLKHVVWKPLILMPNENSAALAVSLWGWDRVYQWQQARDNL